jgi:hypothetical protein
MRPGATVPAFVTATAISACSRAGPTGRPGRRGGTSWQKLFYVSKRNLRMSSKANAGVAEVSSRNRAGKDIGRPRGTATSSAFGVSGFDEASC